MMTKIVLSTSSHGCKGSCCLLPFRCIEFSLVPLIYGCLLGDLWIVRCGTSICTSLFVILQLKVSGYLDTKSPMCKTRLDQLELELLGLVQIGRKIAAAECSAYGVIGMSRVCFVG